MEASWLDVFLFGEESVQYWYLQTGFLPFPVEFFFAGYSLLFSLSLQLLLSGGGGGGGGGGLPWR